MILYEICLHFAFRFGKKNCVLHIFIGMKKSIYLHHSFPVVGIGINVGSYQI